MKKKYYPCFNKTAPSIFNLSDSIFSLGKQSVAFPSGREWRASTACKARQMKTLSRSCSSSADVSGYAILVLRYISLAHINVSYKNTKDKKKYLLMLF